MTNTPTTPTPLDPAILDVLDRVDWRTMELTPAVINSDGRHFIRQKDSLAPCCPLEAAFNLPFWGYQAAPVDLGVRMEIVSAADESPGGFNPALRNEMLRRIEVGMGRVKGA